MVVNIVPKIFSINNTSILLKQTALTAILRKYILAAATNKQLRLV